MTPAAKGLYDDMKQPCFQGLSSSRPPGTRLRREDMMMRDPGNKADMTNLTSSSDRLTDSDEHSIIAIVVWIAQHIKIGDDADDNF